MPRGGKRPGAGAPRGNFNALKHGRRSAQFAQLSVVIAGNPKTRDAILNFAHRLDIKQDNAIKGAIELHARIIEEARKIARGEPSPLKHILKANPAPPAPAHGRPVRRGGEGGGKRLNVQSHDAERRSIIEKQQTGAPTQHGRPPKEKNRRSHNQKTNAVLPNNQTPDTKTPSKPVD
jgi:hypothetical protein